jgi:hypothetical protein
MTKLLSSLSWTLSRLKKRNFFGVELRQISEANQRSARAAEKRLFSAVQKQRLGFDHTRASHLSHYCVFVFLIRRYVSFEKGARVKNWERKNAWSARCAIKKSRPGKI